MPPNISVAVVTFRGERFIADQLTSIAAQLTGEDEIVVSDDDSPDRTRELTTAALAGVATRARIVGGEHVGLRRNVERALRSCTNEIVVLADQDDVWLPGRLDAIRQAFEEPSCTLWFSDAQLIDERGEPFAQSLWERVRLDEAAVTELRSGNGTRRLLHGMTVTGATMALRASVLDLALPLPAELDGVDHLYLHDGWIAVLAALIGTVAADDRRFTLYRQHPDQVTGMRVLGAAGEGGGDPSRRQIIAQEHGRVRLVLDRLRDRDAMSRISAEDRALLERLDRFLGLRAERPSLGRALGLLGMLAAGEYRAQGRSGGTALRDLLARR